MPASPDLSALLVPIALLIFAIVALTAALLFYRSRLLGPDRSSTTAGRLLDDLRAMRDRGEMTPEEYDAAMRRMAERMGPERTGGTMRQAARPRATPEGRVAPPGFDLAGDPLPRPGPDGERRRD